MKFYDLTWNFFKGCQDRTLDRCKYCNVKNYSKGKNEFRIIEDKLELNGRFSSGNRILVNSYSDLFCPQVDVNIILNQIYQMMEHEDKIFIIRTHRVERMRDIIHKYFAGALEHCDNIWLGTFVEKSHYRGRIDTLRDIQCSKRLVFHVPAKKVTDDLDYTDIDWVLYRAHMRVNGEKPHHINQINGIKKNANEQGAKFFLIRNGSMVIKDKYREIPE